MWASGTDNSRSPSCCVWTLQVWAHPKYGDRLDLGLVRQVEESVKAQEVIPQQASCFVVLVVQLAEKRKCMTTPPRHVTSKSGAKLSANAGSERTSAEAV